MKHTRASIKAALVMVSASPGEHWGYELKALTGQKSGIFYPIMQRWIDAQWVHAWDEDPELAEYDRPLRRYVAFTEEGREAMQNWLAQVHGDRRYADLFGPQREAM